MTRPPIKIIEPKDAPSGESQAVAIFEEAGWLTADAAWLGPLSLKLIQKLRRRESDGLDATGERGLQDLAGVLKTPPAQGGRDRALLALYATLCGCGGAGVKFRWWSGSDGTGKPFQNHPDLDDFKTLAGEFRKDRPHAKGADFESAIREHGWPGNYGADSELVHELCDYLHHPHGRFYERPELVRLMDILDQGAAIDLTRIIDPEPMKARGMATLPDGDNPPRVPPPPDLRRHFSFLPSLLSTWLFGLGPRALTLFFDRIRTEPLESKGALALGVREAIERWLIAGPGHETYFREVGPPLAEHTRRYLDDLEACAALKGAEGDVRLRRAWIWFAWCTYESQLNNRPQDRLEVALRAATEDVSRLRKLFARATPKLTTPADVKPQGSRMQPGETREPWEEFEWEKNHFETCTAFLHELGGPWRGMKPMLLAIRSLNAPSVARDLRYWSESNLEPPPELWGVVTTWTINLFQNLIGRQPDRELLELRGQLGGFFLERLVDRWTAKEREEAKRTNRKRTDDDMVERSWAWRYCLVRAFSTLGVNPGGEGHKTLHMASEIDPSDQVRAAARAAYEQVHRGVGLPDGVSPRRAIMSALWWYRQAHLLGLGIQPDDDGAQRTRVKELTRTKEMERGNKPAKRADGAM